VINGEKKKKEVNRPSKSDLYIGMSKKVKPLSLTGSISTDLKQKEERDSVAETCRSKGEEMPPYLTKAILIGGILRPSHLSRGLEETKQTRR